MYECAAAARVLYSGPTKENQVSECGRCEVTERERDGNQRERNASDIGK